MKSFIARSLVVLAGVCLLFPASRAFAATSNDTKPKQPDLQAILDVLKEVKTEADPAPALDRAVKLLAKEAKKTARSDKDKDAQADLAKAATAVTEAQDALKAGDKVKMQEKAGHAASEVKMAIEAKERKN